MTRLERYILEEVAAPFIVGVLLVLVILLGDQLYYLIDMVITKGVPFPTVVRLLLFILPEMAVAAFPLATILAVSLGVNRLAREREWASMRLGGLSLAVGLRPFLVFGIAVGVLSWLVSEHIAPAAKQRFVEITTNLSMADPTIVIEPQQWFKPGSSDNWFYVNSIDEDSGRLYNVIIFSDLGSDYPTALMAREGGFEEGRFRLHDVVRHVWRPDGTLQREGHTKEVIISVASIAPQVMGMPASSRDMSTAQLRQMVDDLESQGVARPDQLIDLHRKYAAPVACFILTLLCVPLNLLTARLGSFVGLLISAVLVIAYFLTLQLGVSLARNGALQNVPVLAVWSQNIVFGLLALGLLSRVR